MTNPPTPPYTEATVELVADAVAQATLAPAIGGTRRHARLVLDALVKAGLLLPEGAETRTEIEFKYRLTYNDGQQKERTAASLDLARAVAASSANWQEPGLPGEVFQRQVTTIAGAWTPVAAEGGGEADQSKERT